MASTDRSLKIRGWFFITLLVGADCVRIDADILRTSLLEEVDDADRASSSTNRFWFGVAGSPVCRTKKGENQVRRYVEKIAKLRSLDAASFLKCLEIAGRIHMFRSCSDPLIQSGMQPVLYEIMYDPPGQHTASETKSSEANTTSEIQQEAARRVAAAIRELQLEDDFHLRSLDIEIRSAYSKLVTHFRDSLGLRPQYGCEINPGPYEFSSSKTLDEQIFGFHCTVESFIDQQPESIKNALQLLRAAFKALDENVSEAVGTDAEKQQLLKQHLSENMQVLLERADLLDGAIAKDLGKDLAKLAREHKSGANPLPPISEPYGVSGRLVDPERINLTDAQGPKLEKLAKPVSSNPVFLQIDNATDFHFSSELQMAPLAVLLIATVVGLLLFWIGNIIYCLTTMATRWQNNRGTCIVAFFTNGR